MSPYTGTLRCLSGFCKAKSTELAFYDARQTATTSDKNVGGEDGWHRERAKGRRQKEIGTGNERSGLIVYEWRTKDGRIRYV